jgi:hypothetical protein
VSLCHRLSCHQVHHRLIQACHTARPLYGPVVRLCVLWASHHLLYGPRHLRHEHIELLVAHLFARPAPFQVLLAITDSIDQACEVGLTSECCVLYMCVAPWFDAGWCVGLPVAAEYSRLGTTTSRRRPTPHPHRYLLQNIG